MPNIKRYCLVAILETDQSVNKKINSTKWHLTRCRPDTKTWSHLICPHSCFLLHSLSIFEVKACTISYAMPWHLGLFVARLGEKSLIGKHTWRNTMEHHIFRFSLIIEGAVSYPTFRMTHPSRNFFVLSLFCVYACLYGQEGRAWKVQLIKCSRRRSLLI